MVLMKKIMESRKRMEAKLQSETDGGVEAKMKKLDHYELVQKRGAIIKEIIRIGKRDKMQYLFEDADFSLYRIKELIAEGERNAENVIEKKRSRDYIA